jgi:streptomycin 3"-adenylyltransferase
MTDLEAYLEQVVLQLRAILGDDVVAIYLHGSAAMGAFVPTRSDVDILVVTSGRIAPDAKAALADTLSALPCPAVGLELSVVTSESARTPSDAPAFELHLNTQGNRVVDGEGGPGDPDLVAHFAMARARGVTILGAPPTDVIASIDRSRLLRTLADDLAWAVEQGMSGYAVLNACRALRFARDGVLCSKPEGGEWAIEQGVADADLVASALRRQGGADVDVEERGAASLAAWVREELLDAATPS